MENFLEKYYLMKLIPESKSLRLFGVCNLPYQET